MADGLYAAAACVIGAIVLGILGDTEEFRELCDAYQLTRRGIRQIIQGIEKYGL